MAEVFETPAYINNDETLDDFPLPPPTADFKVETNIQPLSPDSHNDDDVTTSSTLIMNNNYPISIRMSYFNSKLLTTPSIALISLDNNIELQQPHNLSQPTLKSKLKHVSLNSFSPSLPSHSNLTTASIQNVLGKKANSKISLNNFKLKKSSINQPKNTPKPLKYSSPNTKFASWCSNTLKISSERSRQHEYFKTTTIKTISPSNVFLDYHSSLEPIDDLIQIISYYDTHFTPPENNYVFPPKSNKVDSSPQIESLSFKSLNSFVDAPIAHLSFQLSPNFYTLNSLDHASNSTTSTLNIHFVAGCPTDLLNSLIFSQDKTDIYRFISSFHFFMDDPQSLMFSLISWFNVTFDNSHYSLSLTQIFPKLKLLIQKKVISILEIWMEVYWQDFYQNSTLYSLVLSLINLSHSSDIKYGLQNILRILREKSLISFSSSYLPLPLNINLPLPESQTPLTILNSLSPTCFSKLCFSSSYSFIKLIPLSAFLEFFHTPVSLEPSSIPRLELNSLFNYLSWLKSLGFAFLKLFYSPDPKQSKKLFRYAFSLAKELFNIGDISSLGALIWALKSPRFLSCTKAWSSCKKKERAILLSLDRLLSPVDNFSEYWSCALSSPQTIIPYIIPHMLKAIKIDSEASSTLNKLFFIPSSSLFSSPNDIILNFHSCASRCPLLDDPQFSLNFVPDSSAPSTLFSIFSPTIPPITQSLSSPSPDIPTPISKDSHTTSSTNSNRDNSLPKPESFVNFQKFVDIQDVFLDFFNLAGIDTSRYRHHNPILKPPPNIDTSTLPATSFYFMSAIRTLASSTDLEYFVSQPNTEIYVSDSQSSSSSADVSNTSQTHSSKK